MSEVIRADLELRLGEKVGPIEPIPEGHSGFTYYVDLPSGPAVLAAALRELARARTTGDRSASVATAFRQPSNHGADEQGSRPRSPAQCLRRFINT